MGDEMYPYVEAAAEQYRKEYCDEKVETFHYSEQDIKLGYGVDYHPCEANQKTAARELIQRLEGMMKD